ncbi:hypothetical protein MXB_14 [Myxobolus squamalis]|nr:hypothetical protein MXB_14 [Myxobolus squamalis]
MPDYKVLDQHMCEQKDLRLHCKADPGINKPIHRKGHTLMQVKKEKNLLKYLNKIYYKLLEHVKDFGPGCIFKIPSSSQSNQSIDNIRKPPHSKLFKERHSCTGISLEILTVSLTNYRFGHQIIPFLF